MSVKDRIKKLVKHEGLTIKAFEKSICTSNGYVNSISKSIGLDKIEKIIEKYPNIDLKWLLTGKGPMLLENENIASEPAAVYKKIPVQEKESPQVAVLREKIILLERAIKDKEEIINLQKDRIEKDWLQIERLKQKVRRLKESLEKKNADNKPVGAGTSLSSKPAANKPGIVPSEKIIKNPQRPRKSS